MNREVEPSSASSIDAVEATSGCSEVADGDCNVDGTAGDSEEEDGKSDGSLLLSSLSDDFVSDDFNLRPPPRVVRAEAVLAHRTSRIVLVLEHMVDSLNHQAVLRTAEAMGVQHIYAVDNGVRKGYTVKGGIRITPTVTTGSSKWLSLHTFASSEACIDALRREGCDIWATSLDPDALPLTAECIPLPLPPRVAVVMGREVDGVSPAMLAASSRRVYLPQVGFTESFNVSVATALVLQRMFDLCPEMRGAMGEDERAALRVKWYTELAPRVEKQAEYAMWVEKGNRGEIEWKDADLRPKEVGRVPRVNPRQRQRMTAAGQREVRVSKGGAEAEESKLAPHTDTEPS